MGVTMTPSERFDVRPQAKKAKWRNVDNVLDNARRAAVQAYSAFYAGADNQHEVFKAELELYDQLKHMYKNGGYKDDKETA